jgi:hypothetical protein
MAVEEAAGREPPMVTYEPGSRRRVRFWRCLLSMAINLVGSRELIKQLFIRDYLSAYKKSFLALTWIAISPLLGIISWLFMNAAGILTCTRAKPMSRIRSTQYRLDG